MKISIDTLPLWDAFRQTEQCPFCYIEGQLETLFLDTYLGDAVMEPDVRVEVNQKGFCRDHFKLLFAQPVSKLGLALMTHTHLQQTMAETQKHMEAIDRRAGESTLLKRATGARDLNDAISAAAKAVEEHGKTCVICERMDQHMERYVETAIDLNEHDREFAALFEACHGFCLPHWGAQLKACSGLMVGKGKLEYLRKLNGIQAKALNELEQDLAWFTQKFDYRNADKPWGNSKDALPRAINTLMGQLVEKE